MYSNRKSVTLETAQSIAARAIALGRSRNINVSVAIVGVGAELMAHLCDTNATLHSRETSRRKAQTAVSTRKPTGWMDAALAVELPMATGNFLTNVRGGMPIIHDGEVIGAIGIAGGTVAQDEEIAKAALDSSE
jgi:glc operon protein GlcG